MPSAVIAKPCQSGLVMDWRPTVNFLKISLASGGGGRSNQDV
jgi:hypothetical protein